LIEFQPATSGIQYIGVVGRCTNLRSLDLRHCTEIRDITPLSTLSLLHTLHISSSHIESVDVLSDLRQLTLLDLTLCTNLTNLTPLSSLNHLIELRLAVLEYAESISSLSSLTGLERLFLEHMESIPSLTPLENSTLLKQLSIQGMSIEDLEPLKRMTLLERLNLQECEYILSIESLTNLCQLWELQLGSSVTSLLALSSLCALLDLRMDCNESLPYSALHPLSLCTTLKQLDISYCSLFDLSPLASCLSLRRLYTTDPYEQQVPWLRRVLPNLEVMIEERDEFLDARTL
jgi:internalin A